MKYYRSFGLTIGSDIELTELIPIAAVQNPDITVVTSDLGLIQGAQRPIHHFSETEQIMVYPGVAAFRMIGTDQILIEPAKDAPESYLAYPLLGPVMGLLLHLRGHFLLHASAVEFNGRGYGFVGDKGAGKSTLAAALVQDPGVTLLTDDLLVFDDRERILPAFPQLKLASDALESLADLDADRKERPTEDFPKTPVRLRAGMQSQKTPVAGIFELRRDEHPRIESLASADAMKVLLRFSYAVRFSTREISEAERRSFFLRIVPLAKAGIVKRLYAPIGVNRLGEVKDLIASA
ncbi:MAG: serine kinase [Pseudomonadota bacterium]